jgi:hypothetical protein
MFTIFPKYSVSTILCVSVYVAIYMYLSSHMHTEKTFLFLSLYYWCSRSQSYRGLPFHYEKADNQAICTIMNEY